MDAIPLPGMGHEPGSLDDTSRAIILRSYLAWVTMQHRTAEAAALNRRQAIDEARQWGATWDDLGDAMGMSRQTAHKRYGRSGVHP